MRCAYCSYFFTEAEEGLQPPQPPPPSGYRSLVCVHVQKTSELFNDIDAHVRNERSTELIDLLLQCELVELVQKMWRKYFTQEQLEKMAVLPDHLSSSLAVMHITYVCIIIVVVIMIGKNIFRANIM